MAKSKLPTPSEAAGEVDRDDLAAGRATLRRSLKSSKGQAFTYSAELFPSGTAETLLAELKEAGWKCKYVSDSRDGDYYEISPRKSR